MQTKLFRKKLLFAPQVGKNSFFGSENKLLLSYKFETVVK